jgi:hypothetical protein
MHNRAGGEDSHDAFKTCGEPETEQASVCATVVRPSCCDRLASEHSVMTGVHSVVHSCRACRVCDKLSRRRQR